MSGVAAPLDVSFIANRLREIVTATDDHSVEVDHLITLLAGLATAGTECPECGEAADTAYSGGELGEGVRFSCPNGHPWGAEWPA
jgi:hypothetical protein